MESEFRKLSFWHDSVPGTLEPRPALTSDTEADIVIVGAGYTGLWTAYYLKQIDPSLNIAILEAEAAGFGASGRNGGWCASYLSGIDQWLDDPAHRVGAIRLQRLMFDTVREVGRVSERESIDCHFEQSGTLEVALLPVQMQRLRDELDYVRSFGFGDDDYLWLDGDEVHSTLRVDGALGGILMNHCAAIHPARLARGLADTVENSGVQLYEQSPVLKIDAHTAITPAGKVSAEKIILATEGYTGSLPGQNRRLIPLHSMMVVTEPLSPGQIGEIHFHKRFAFGNLDRIVTYGQLTADNRIAFGCRGSYHFKSGIREFDPADTEFELVRKSLLRFFPSLEGIRFTHAWGGAMGVSRTLRPSVNFSPETGLGWAGGFFGNGVGATHLAGRTMADLVLGRDTDRVNTPWANPPDALRRWEPEPLRWLGIAARMQLMHMADKAEYRGSRFAPAIAATLDKLFP